MLSTRTPTSSAPSAAGLFVLGLLIFVVPVLARPANSEGLARAAVGLRPSQDSGANIVGTSHPIEIRDAGCAMGPRHCLLGSGRVVHGIVVLRKPVGRRKPPDEVARVELLERLAEGVWVAAIGPQGHLLPDDILSARPLRVEEKFSEALPPYEGEIALMVEIHQDVSPQQALDALAQFGAREVRQSTNRWVVAANRSQILEVAALDLVRRVGIVRDERVDQP